MRLPMLQRRAAAKPASLPHPYLASASLICAFFIPPLGIVFGHISRHLAKQEGLST